MSRIGGREGGARRSSRLVKRGVHKGAGGGQQVFMDWSSHLEVEPAKALALIGRLAMEDIEVSARDKGQKGSGRPMPALDGAYAKQKQKAGGSPTADLFRSGELWQSFRLLAQDKRSVLIGFALTTAQQAIKFKTLTKNGRNPLSISRRDLKRFFRAAVSRGLLKVRKGPPKT